MRIHCKQCGKEYRVRKEYLTEEGIRAKCRKCGAVLRIRLRKKETSGAGKGLPGAISQVSSPSVSPYHYCIACGHLLEREVPSAERPLCPACEILDGAEKESLAFGHPDKSPLPLSLLYALIFVVLLFSALLGYRLALS
ncbi:MAG: hypothetical protein GXP58_10280 [Deltaproteobacteria bacterium]|nr:hypothetical protein [Deltaproteobacteria bacterium]